MKKVLALLLGCFMVLVATAVMADTRTDSMGLGAGLQVDDLDSIWLFPQDAANFGNVVDFRLGNASFYNTSEPWFGVIHKDWDDIGYIGIYTGRPFLGGNTYAGTSNSVLSNQFGVFNGNEADVQNQGAGNGWAGLLNPHSSAVLGNPSQTGYFGHVGATFTTTGPANENFPWYTGTGDNIVDPQNKLDLFWAKNFGDSTFGVHVNYADNDGTGSSKATDPTTDGTTPGAGHNLAQTGNEDSSAIGVDLGLTMKNVGFDTLAVALGGSIGSLDYESVNTKEENNTSDLSFDNKLKDNNISELRLNVLGKSKINDTTTGRVFLAGSLDNLGVTNTALYDFNENGNYNDANETYVGTSTYTNTNLSLGIACDHNVADGKAHVIAGLSLVFDDRKWSQTAASNANGGPTADVLVNGDNDTYEETFLAVPLNVGVEAPLFSWLKARVGASYQVYQSYQAKTVNPYNLNAGGTAFQDTATVTNTIDPTSNINMYMGVGATMENFSLDLQVNESDFMNYLSEFQPGNGVFYNNGNTQLFTRADLRYAF